MCPRQSSTQRTLRWGLLSTAHINRSVLDPLSRSRRSDLVAVASRDRERARSYAERHAIPRAYGTYEELLEDPEIDVVYISLPNHLHCQWTVAAATAGKHVLCEKPLVLSLEEMSRVERAAATRTVTIFEAFMYLHHPQSLHLQAWVRAGELGRLETVRSHFGFHLPPESGNVRLRPEMGGGSLWDVGVYPVSLSVVLADAGAPVEVFGTRRDGDSGIDVGFEGLLRFANGVVAQVSSSFRGPLSWGATLSGSEAVVTVDGPWKPGFEGAVSRVAIRRRADATETLRFCDPDPYACEIAAMEACVLDGADPVVPLRLSRQILATVLALYRSAATGAPVFPAAV